MATLTPSPERSVTGIATWLQRSANGTPEAPFLLGDTPINYREVWQQVEALAAGMHASGLKAGDRILVVSRNRNELAVLIFAAARIGVVFTLLHEEIRPMAFERILNQCEPKRVFLDSSGKGLRELIDDLPVVWFGDNDDRPMVDETLEGFMAGADEAVLTEVASPSGDDLAFLVFTSGSTGNPRGVMLTHRNVEFVCEAIQARLGYRAEDRIGLFLPLSFDYGLYQIFYTAMVGAGLYVGSSAEAGPGLARTLAAREISVLPGVPTLFGGLAKMLRYRPVELPHLRQLTNTGDHLPRSVIDVFRGLLPQAGIFPMYGLTECKRVSILLPSELDAKPDSVGRALDGTEVFAVDAEGHRLPAGEVGEWVVRGPHVSPGYWRAPEETAKRFRTWPETGETVLFSGDQGRVDHEGFLFFHARSDFMIKHKGHRLSPVEIEEAACMMPEVETAGCVKDEEKEQLCLFVGSDGRELDPADVTSVLQTVLEPVKVPDRVVVLDALPKTANQKVDRKALRQWLRDHA